MSLIKLGYKQYGFDLLHYFWILFFAFLIIYFKFVLDIISVYKHFIL